MNENDHFKFEDDPVQRRLLQITSVAVTRGKVDG